MNLLSLSIAGNTRARTYDVDEAEEFVPGILDDAQLLEVDVDHAGVVVHLVDLLTVVDQPGLVDEEGLLQGAEG